MASLPHPECRSFVLDIADEYYKTPDGEDCSRKAWLVTRATAYVGLGIAGTDLILINHPKTVYDVLHKFKRIVFPLAVGGFAGALAICALTNLRGKDTAPNHYFGSFLGAVAMMTARGSPGAGIGYGACIAPIFAVMKYYQIHDDVGTLHNDKLWALRPVVDDFWLTKFDTTLTEKVPRGWKRADEI